MKNKIKSENQDRDIKHKLLTQFKTFRNSRSQANQKELKINLEVAKMELHNYQLQVSKVKNHIKKLTTHDRINKLNLKLKKRAF